MSCHLLRELAEGTIITQVGGIPGVLDMLGDVLSIVRNKAINVIAATQKPTVAVTISLAKANFACRLVGRVADAAEAALATGRRDSGVHLLPATGGAFLSIDGADPLRFQAYRLDLAGIAAILQRACTAWGAATPATTMPVAAAAGPVATAPAADQQPPAPPARDELPPALAPLLPQWLQPDGTLRYGGTRVLLKALFGPLAATTGRNYQEQCNELKHYIELYHAQRRKVSRRPQSPIYRSGKPGNIPWKHLWKCRAQQWRKHELDPRNVQ